MPYDADQIANLAAELDALEAPTTAQVLAHSQDYDAGIVAAEAARRAIGAAGGGSQTVKVVRVPIAFDTPDLTFPGAGITIYEPTDGEVYLGSYCTIPVTAWDGTTPRLSTGPLGDLGHYLSGGLDAVDQATFSGDTTQPASANRSGSVFTGSGVMEILHADPIVALVDDGAGGDPNDPTPMTQGEGEIVIVILAAAA
jgi:hypothetical protein